MFKEIKLTAEQAQRPNAPNKVYQNSEFLVQVFNLDNEPTRLTVNKVKRKGNDWADGITWDQLMQIKRLLGYASKCAVEIYPPDKDIVNVANMRHLWIVDMPDFAWKNDKVAEMSKQYRIESLGDFLKIPADRIEDCMKELACHLTAMRMTIDNFGLEPQGNEVKSFTWDDDGKEDLEIKASVGDEVIKAKFTKEAKADAEG